MDELLVDDKVGKEEIAEDEETPCEDTCGHRGTGGAGTEKSPGGGEIERAGSTVPEDPKGCRTARPEKLQGTAGGQVLPQTAEVAVQVREFVGTVCLEFVMLIG